MSHENSISGKAHSVKGQSLNVTSDEVTEAATGGGCGGGLGAATRDALGKIERELREFETTERKRLGIEDGPVHWDDAYRPTMTVAERDTTTLLFGGLTAAHDALIEAGIQSRGYKAKALKTPDSEDLQTGKEFGNRGQCNPTYFTVGSLVKHLVDIRDKEGKDADQIRKDYAFVTFGACGPCRFGTYVTEYRKALRDAGFPGFRLIPLSQEGPGSGGGEEAGLNADMGFYVTILKALFAGDVVNALGYRIRPYEVEKGTTNEAKKECIVLLQDAFRHKRSVLRAMWQCRKIFGKVKVDRLQPKPKVSIIGEFWAMTTEGDGNYHLQTFLEEEGAEVEIQLITGWALYIFWSIAFDIRESTMLRRRRGEIDRFEGLAPRKGIFYAWLAARAVKAVFYSFAKLAGLHDYKLPDMQELADLAKEYYPSQLRGGEGHMEVGKVILSAKKKKTHLVISVKPFGCMPSSGVSDGVQALVTARFPDIGFLPIETTGDSAVNAYSRIQMALFKARIRAREEFDEALKKKGLTAEQAAGRASARSRPMDAIRYPAHAVTGTGANAVYELG